MMSKRNRLRSLSLEKKSGSSGEMPASSKIDSKEKEADVKPARKKVRRVASKKSLGDKETADGKSAKKENSVKLEKKDKVPAKKPQKEQSETGEPK